MHTRRFERGGRHESLETGIARIAAAYGFSASPVPIPRKSLAVAGDTKTAAVMALMRGAKTPTQSWGFARKGAGTVVAFSVVAARPDVAGAITVKTALSVAELAGFTDLSVAISSVGDAESRRRFARELTNFFRKNHDALPDDVRPLVAGNPEAAYRLLAGRDDPLLIRAPRSIDHLSETSRKNMLGVLSLFESIGIPYAIEPRLIAEAGVQSEILFAIEGTARHGERVRIASGGRYDEYLRRERGSQENGVGVGVAIEVPQRIDCEEATDGPACFVVHVGDAAKLKTFAVLDALWRAHIAVGQALMTENLRDQMQQGALSNARYLAIIGQREALDGTVIVRNVSTQMQTVLPLDRLAAYVSRTRRK